MILPVLLPKRCSHWVQGRDALRGSQSPCRANPTTQQTTTATAPTRCCTETTQQANGQSQCNASNALSPEAKVQCMKAIPTQNAKGRTSTLSRVRKTHLHSPKHDTPLHTQHVTMR